MKFLLDTNILLRLSQPRHPHHEPTLAALDLLRHRELTLDIVPQNLYEYWAVATRSQQENGLGFTAQRIQAEIASICQLFMLLRDERSIFDRWLIIVEQHDVRGKSTHDTRLVAAMQRHGLSHLLTFNRADFSRFTEISVLTPDEIPTWANSH